MTREEYENAIKSVHGFDFENNVPVYDGDISIYQNFMDIKDEYIESLEKEVEKWRKEAKYNYALYEENLEPDDLEGFSRHCGW